MKPTAHRWAAVAAALSLLMLVSARTASAAPKAPKGDGPLVKLVDAVNDALAKVTDLTDEQKASTHTIIEDARAQIVALRDDAKAAKGDKDARQQLRTKATKIVKEARDKLEAALTPDQRKEFRAAMKDAREQAKQARDGKQGDAPTTQQAN